MSEEQETTVQTKNIYQRMAAVMKAVAGVDKGSENKHSGYRYAGHEAVTAALRGAYTKVGIVRTASVIHQERIGKLLRLTVEVRWINVDDPKDFCAVRILGESQEPTKADASATQAGVALSYAVKNAEFKAFSLTGDSSPDSEQQEDSADNSEAEYVVDMIFDRLENAADLAELESVKAAARGSWSVIKKAGKGDAFQAALKATTARLGQC